MTSLHKLQSTWVVWYHNPSDNNWELSSYKKLFEFNTLEDFFKFQNTWKGNLPEIKESMFFLMKKIDEHEYIYPLWEDKNNQKGGCWSFKVNSEGIDDVWLNLCFYLISGSIGSDENITKAINGLSFSPKKGFCIVKIWNSTIENQEIELLNRNLKNILPVNESLYKSHIESIVRDQKKKQKFEKYNSQSRRNYSNKSLSGFRSSGFNSRRSNNKWTR